MPKTLQIWDFEWFAGKQVDGVYREKFRLNPLDMSGLWMEVRVYINIQDDHTFKITAMIDNEVLPDRGRAKHLNAAIMLADVAYNELRQKYFIPEYND